MRNAWEQKESTCHPHFGSSLFVVNSKLYVAGGNVSLDDDDKPCGLPAAVEGYDEENNKWSVVEQSHISANNLGAVEIEGRDYFLINKFPVDSGIRIPPGEVYPVCLDEWENLGKVDKSAVLCYAPVKDTYKQSVLSCLCQAAFCVRFPEDLRRGFPNRSAYWRTIVVFGVKRRKTKLAQRRRVYAYLILTILYVGV